MSSFNNFDADRAEQECLVNKEKFYQMNEAIKALLRSNESGKVTCFPAERHKQDTWIARIDVATQVSVIGKELAHAIELADEVRFYTGKGAVRMECYFNNVAAPIPEDYHGSNLD